MVVSSSSQFAHGSTSTAPCSSSCVEEVMPSMTANGAGGCEPAYTVACTVGPDVRELACESSSHLMDNESLGIVPCSGVQSLQVPAFESFEGEDVANPTVSEKLVVRNPEITAQEGESEALACIVSVTPALTRQGGEPLSMVTPIMESVTFHDSLPLRLIKGLKSCCSSTSGKPTRPHRLVSSPP
jgi:hypothetical protein